MSGLDAADERQGLGFAEAACIPQVGLRVFQGLDLFGGLHVGDAGRIVGGEGHQGHLPQVELLQGADAADAVVGLVAHHEPDRQAVERTHLQQLVGFGAAGGLERQLALDVQADGVFFHVGVDADRLAAAVLPEQRRLAGLEAVGERTRHDDLVVGVQHVEHAAVAREHAVVVDGLDLEGEVELLLCHVRLRWWAQVRRWGRWSCW